MKAKNVQDLQRLVSMDDIARYEPVGFYPVSADGLERAENFRS